MAESKSKTPSVKTPVITSLNEVGRYAVGVKWSDGHDSIYPLATLRRRCPCEACHGEIEGEIPPASQRLRAAARMGEAALFLSWGDGHETLYTLAHLRTLCRCAYCAGEPERPISGR